jgi:general secretion pathway protein G
VSVGIAGGRPFRSQTPREFEQAKNWIWETIEMRKHMGHVQKHPGFTLVELVVVVMILGILAAVAAPKLLGTSSAAAENGLRQTLSIVRDAIERYAAENGGDLPGVVNNPQSLKDDLARFLRGPFPTCPVGPNKNDNIAVVNESDPMTPAGSEGWRYSVQTGTFIVNSSETPQHITGVTGDHEL